MSPREGVTPAFGTSIAEDSAEMVHLVALDFSGGIVRLTNGAHDLAWNGETWEAVGGLIEIGGMEESSDIRAHVVDLTLSGVDQAILAALLTQQYRGRPAHIWRAHLDSVTGQVVADPLLLFSGLQLAAYRVEEERNSRSGGTVRIKTRLLGRFGHPRVRGLQANLASHQHHFAGDTFLQHTANLEARLRTGIFWGHAAPATTPRGGSSLSDPGYQPPTNFF